LGVIYANGNGVLKDYKKAINWYKKAAKNGDTRTQFNLGFIYHKGSGVERDEKKAVYW